jgi:competence protein ComGC
VGGASGPGWTAFTVIELVVVSAIIGIPAALLLPVLSKGKQTGQRTYCITNGKQMMGVSLVSLLNCLLLSDI